MKIVTTLLNFLFFTISVAAQQSIDTKNGYKDLIFESDLSSFLASHKTIKLQSKNASLIYKLLDAKYLNVGECKIEEVDVTFFKNKLMSFNIKVDKENKTCYLNALYYAWGDGLIVVKGKDSYIWNGNKCLAIFQDDATMKAGSLLFFTKALKNQYDAQIQNNDKLNSKDL